MATRILITFGLVLSIAVGGVWHWSSTALNQPLDIPDSKTVIEAKAGDGLIKVLRRLERLGLIQSARATRLALRIQGHSVNLKLGEYELQQGDTLLDVLERFERGEVVLYPVTIPEGVTFDWILAHLESLDFISHTITGPDDTKFEPFRSSVGHLEGQFLPETYFVARGQSDISILDRSFAAMQETLSAVWVSCDAKTPLKSPYEALILASIVERETGVASERPQIAGVFTRRLIKGMRLQTDPTIIYGLGDAYDGNLRRKHLNDTENPYNTYQIKGLPPTPIAMPGREAVAAVCNPTTDDSLYFVAKGDGSHAFSATLSEHNQNVRRYQLNRRSDYRSSPAP